MKAIYFCNDFVVDTINSYNIWAKNKVLAKDVIIHSHITPPLGTAGAYLLIVIFFDERIHPDWAPESTCPNIDRAIRGNT